MDLNTQENRDSLIGHFSALRSDKSFEVHSPQDCGYNCIAWAMGFDDRWVDYILNSPKKWWPKGVDNDYRPESLVKAFEAVGFEMCNDDTVEEGYDKVALYKASPFYDPLSRKIVKEGWSHAARVLTSGQYHSKVGESFDIYHRSGDVFDGTSYGNIFQFMRRPVEKRDIVERIKQSEPVQITIPPNLDDLIIKILASGKL